MAYYDLFIAAWNNVTQPPPGVTGTGLLGGDTTVQKLAKLNAWTVTGAVPTTIYVTGSQILNCINWNEFNSISTTAQANILSLCNNPGQLLGGSGNTTHLVDGLLLANFTVGSQTIASLTALAQSVTQPWWQANGYPRPFTTADAALAGVS